LRTIHINPPRDRTIFADLISRPTGIVGSPATTFEVFVEYVGGSLSGYDTRNNCLLDFARFVEDAESGGRPDIISVHVERMGAHDSRRPGSSLIAEWHAPKTKGDPLPESIMEHLRF